MPGIRSVGQLGGLVGESETFFIDDLAIVSH
jgi:hypothetical protein